MSIAKQTVACVKQALFGLMMPIAMSESSSETALLISKELSWSIRFLRAPHLVDMCEKLGYAYYPFDNFFDIMKQLEAEPVA